MTLERMEFCPKVFTLEKGKSHNPQLRKAVRVTDSTKLLAPFAARNRQLEGACLKVKVGSEVRILGTFRFYPACGLSPWVTTGVFSQR